jgi:hypothetical protein
MEKPENEKNEFNRVVGRKTIRAFTWFILFILTGIACWRWLNSQPEDNGALKPLRKMMNSNGNLFSSAVFDEHHLAPEYPISKAATDVRVNGDVGMSEDFDTAEWKLQVIRFHKLAVQTGDTFYVTLDEIKKLPKTEVVFNFKCIEGWSQITWWGGVRFSDFAKAYNLGFDRSSLKDDRIGYAGMYTPDREYYVGIDMKSMMHPQTILCYEMNGKPLPDNQGAPLRLIIPVKYGIKHIKRIGTIYFSESPPPDYWFEQGYDYYAGL